MFRRSPRFRPGAKAGRVTAALPSLARGSKLLLGIYSAGLKGDGGQHDPVAPSLPPLLAPEGVGTLARSLIAVDEPADCACAAPPLHAPPLCPAPLPLSPPLGVAAVVGVWEPGRLEGAAAVPSGN